MGVYELVGAKTPMYRMRLKDAYLDISSAVLDKLEKSSKFVADGKIPVILHQDTGFYATHQDLTYKSMPSNGDSLPTDYLQSYFNKAVAEKTSVWEYENSLVSTGDIILFSTGVEAISKDKENAGLWVDLVFRLTKKSGLKRLYKMLDTYDINVIDAGKQFAEGVTAFKCKMDYMDYIVLRDEFFQTLNVFSDGFTIDFEDDKTVIKTTADLENFSVFNDELGYYVFNIVGDIDTHIVSNFTPFLDDLSFWLDEEWYELGRLEKSKSGSFGVTVN